MPNLGPVNQDVYVDEVLGVVSIAYRNESYVADKIFPQVNVTKRTGIYYTYDKSNLRLVNDYRAPRTRAQTVDYGLNKSPYGPLIEHALEQPIEWELQGESVIPLDADVDATQHVSDRILLSKEADAFSQLSNTGVITQTLALSGTSRWDDIANSDPVGDVRTMVDTVKKEVLKQTNHLTILMGYEVYSALRNHPQILERMKYSQLGVLSTDLLAQIFDVKEVVIGHAEYVNANQLATDVMTYVWGKNVWVMYVNPQTSIKSVTFGYTLRMGGRIVTRWSEPQIKTDYVRVEDYYQQLIVAPKACYYLSTVVN